LRAIVSDTCDADNPAMVRTMIDVLGPDAGAVVGGGGGGVVVVVVGGATVVGGVDGGAVVVGGVVSGGVVSGVDVSGGVVVAVVVWASAWPKPRNCTESTATSAPTPKRRIARDARRCDCLTVNPRCPTRPLPSLRCSPAHSPIERQGPAARRGPFFRRLWTRKK
jgi:hypothetical protein